MLTPILNPLNEKGQKILETQFKYAIDARDKLNDNFYKWMSYYYLTNAAILVAISTLASKTPSDKGILILSIIGIFICILGIYLAKAITTGQRTGLIS